MKILEKGATETQRKVLEAQVKEAEAEYEIMKAKMRECEINAPFSGIITKVFLRKGDLVRENRDDVTILEMMETSSMVVAFHIPEQYAHLIKKNADVSISFDYPNGKFYNSKIVRVYPEIDETTHTLTVEASLNKNKVSPGMFVRVRLPVQSAKNALVITDAALLGSADNYYVFVFKEGKAEKRKVGKGLESESFVQIINGLSPNDLVITDGNTNLKPGISVKLKKK